jgi:DNA-binding YbaB/EbfC family protein
MRSIWKSRTDLPPTSTQQPMPDFMKILQQAQEMQGRFQKIQDELAQQTVTGSAGGGMVTAVVSGTGQIKKIKLEPGVVNPADVEMLEDLVVVAISDAQQKAQKLAQDEMGKLTGGMSLPFKLPF